MTSQLVALFLSFCASAAFADTAPTPVDAAVAAAGIGKTLPPISIAATNMTGGKAEAVQFDSQKVGKPIAYVIVGTHCPTTAAYVERFMQLEQAYAAKGVAFVYVYPNREDTTEAKLDFHKSHNLEGTLIDDKGGNVARQLAASRTSEFILADKNGTLLFRGALDDSKEPSAVKVRYAATAMDEFLAGKPISKPVSTVFA